MISLHKMALKKDPLVPILLPNFQTLHKFENFDITCTFCNIWVGKSLNL